MNKTQLFWLFEDADGTRYSAPGATSFHAKMVLKNCGVTAKLYTLWEIPLYMKPIGGHF